MKFDYQIKLNSLYLAQMRKQTADRATAFALAQGSLSDHNTDSQNKTIGSINTISDQIGIIDFSVSFMGCTDLNYPPISGMSQVKQVIPSNSSYILLSGRTLMYGNCSVVEPVKIGDWIKFEGYVIKTFVNAVKIQKTTLLQ